MASRIPITATTIISSMRVKPWLPGRGLSFLMAFLDGACLPPGEGKGRRRREDGADGISSHRIRVAPRGKGNHRSERDGD
jgi:hypothetical protein